MDKQRVAFHMRVRDSEKLLFNVYRVWDDEKLRQW
jgi:hypothetical protein